MSKVVVAHVSVSIGTATRVEYAHYDSGVVGDHGEYSVGVNIYDIPYEYIPVNFAGYDPDELYPIFTGLYTSGDYGDPAYFYFSADTYLLVGSEGTTDIVWNPDEDEDTKIINGEMHYIYASNVVPVVEYMDSASIMLDDGDTLAPGVIFNKQIVDVGYHAEWTETYNGDVRDHGSQDLHNYYLSSYDVVLALESGLEFTKKNDTAIMALATNRADVIVSPIKSGVLTFAAPDEDADVSAELTTSTAVTAAVDGTPLTLTANQIKQLKGALSLEVQPGDMTDGKLSWTIDPRKLGFIAPGETVSVTYTVKITDADGGIDTAEIAAEISGPERSGVAVAAEKGELILGFKETMEGLYETARELAEPVSKVKVDHALNDFVTAMRRVGVALDAASVVIDYDVAYANAKTQEDRDAATRQMVGEMVWLGIQTSISTGAEYLVKKYGVERVVLGMVQRGIAGLAVESAIFGEAAVLMEVVAAGAAVAPAVITAVAVVGGLWAIDHYLLDGFAKNKVVSWIDSGLKRVGTPDLVFYGVGTEGYLANSTVFADADGDGRKDKPEASDKTDKFGQFELVDPRGDLVATGGKDSLTGLRIRVDLRAPEGSAVITPLTTLVAVLMDLGLTREEAVAKVMEALQLSPSVSLLDADPQQASAESNAAYAKVFALGIGVYSNVMMGAAVLDGAGSTLAAGGRAMFAASAEALRDGTPGDMATIVRVAAAKLGLSLDPETVDVLVAVAAEATAAIEEALATYGAGAELHARLGAIGGGAQGFAVLSLTRFAAGDTSAADVLEHFTGDGFAQLVDTLLPDVPIQASSDFGTVAAGKTLKVINEARGVLGDDFGPWGSDLVVTRISGEGGAGEIGAALEGAYGSLTMHADGTYKYVARDRAAGPSAVDHFVYRVSDGNGHNATASLDIHVSGPPPVLHAPEIVSGRGRDSAKLTVEEYKKALTTIVASDRDGDKVKFAIDGGADAALFKIGAKSGKLAFKSSHAFDPADDAGHDHKYKVVIRAYEPDGEFDLQTLTIALKSRPAAMITGTGKGDTIDAARSPSGQKLPGSGADTISGNKGSDLLSALAGADKISGGRGNDTIAGGAGVDTVSGGKGRDAFVLSGAPGKDDLDRVTDFSHRDDTIWLDDEAMSDLGPWTEANFLSLASGHVADSDAVRILYNRKDGSLWYDSDGDGPDAALQIAVLTTAPRGVDWTDFAVV